MNYPDNIELASRLLNNIGLPDYIGLVKYCQSTVGGWDLNWSDIIRLINIVDIKKCHLVESI
ncbi:hypothetical protein ACP9IA_003177 [Proteus mirabilis]